MTTIITIRIPECRICFPLLSVLLILLFWVLNGIEVYTEVGGKSDVEASGANIHATKEDEVTLTYPNYSNESQKQEQPKQGPICLVTRFYGRDCNRIFQVANMLTLARELNAEGIKLDEDWSTWYRNLLQDRPDVFFFNETDQNCSRTLRSQDAQFYYTSHKVHTELFDLKLKEEYLEAARNAVVNLAPFVSVHRRTLEQTCRDWARKAPQKNGTWCLTYDAIQNYEDWCDIVYQNITERTNQTVILFTDGQSREFDSTFPNRDRHDFPVQLAMMTMSEVHYGNPQSSVDYMVAHWRRGKDTRPAECFSISS